ncbi:hypothetical protein BV25DRAFT_1827369 [Artomyces pyxidatus]|uniref:Uncharacterized protein n=1 Tax=Artomyces pyxidatus TaxID=48021 RepID=A0ACB8SY48_9AGAM|nr:hypothetical protein BV25DRAFT_1827369 [Artomyces pyxidatus]
MSLATQSTSTKPRSVCLILIVSASVHAFRSSWPLSTMPSSATHRDTSARPSTSSTQLIRHPRSKTTSSSLTGLSTGTP